MKKNIVKKLVAVVAAGTLMFGLSACDPYSENSQRKEKQKSVVLDNSLESNNLKEKLKREDDPNAIRYVYLMNFGQIVGYYTIEGKVSSSGSQLGPEEEIIYGGGNGNVVDSAQDDGTYGTGDPGIFFFTTEGVMVETSLDYIVSDQVLPIDIPRLDK